MSGSVSYHAVWQQKTCLDEVSLASTYASNLACLFGDSGRFSNLDFSASELSAELNLAIGKRERESDDNIEAFRKTKKTVDTAKSLELLYFSEEMITCYILLVVKVQVKFSD